MPTLDKNSREKLEEKIRTRIEKAKQEKIFEKVSYVAKEFGRSSNGSYCGGGGGLAGEFCVNWTEYKLAKKGILVSLTENKGDISENKAEVYMKKPFLGIPLFYEKVYPETRKSYDEEGKSLKINTFKNDGQWLGILNELYIALMEKTPKKERNIKERGQEEKIQEKKEAFGITV